MLTSLAHVSLVVRDYDEALSWFTDKLGLELRMDGSMGDDYRFLTVGVKGQKDVDIVLHKPFKGYSEARSNIHGFVFFSDDCRKDVDAFKERGVNITQGPEEVPWGIQAVFEDLYGNTHVLLEPRAFAVQ